MKLPSAIVVVLVLGYGGYSLLSHFDGAEEAPDEFSEEERFLIEEAEREAQRNPAPADRAPEPTVVMETVVLEPLSASERVLATQLAHAGDQEVGRLLSEYKARLETVEIRAAAGKDALGLAAERKAGPELRRVVLEQLNSAKRDANTSRAALSAVLDRRQAMAR